MRCIHYLTISLSLSGPASSSLSREHDHGGLLLCAFFLKSSFTCAIFSLSVGGASPQHIILKLPVMLL